MTAQNSGISDVTARDLRGAFASAPGIEQVWIFGSRGRGTARDVSDIDLAVDAPAWSTGDFQALHRRLLDLTTLYKLDVVHWQGVHEPVFRQEIERDRKVFWQAPKGVPDVPGVSPPARHIPQSGIPPSG